MNYKDLELKQQQHVNGVLSKHMDKYIRDHLVWTPEQMYEDLIDKLKDDHSKGWYGNEYYIDGKGVFVFKVGNMWMVSDEAKEFIIDRFYKKYEKNKKLARKKSPMIDRIRFGIRWSERSFFDISYGLKNQYNFEKMDLVEDCELIPWSIDHVENELASKYSTSIPEIFNKLSNSPIEVLFYTEWLRRYFNKGEFPALIPEVCGDRRLYYCYKKNNEYSLKNDFDSKAVNVRFDFAIINHKKQKKILIELDGHDYHKTIDQRINDSIKRSIATKNGWQLNVITGSQIKRDIDSVFNDLEEYFEI